MISDGISIKQRLIDIRNMPKMARKLIGIGKTYDHLLKVILNIPLSFEYVQRRRLTIKEVAEKSNLDYDKTRKQISMIYEDLLDYEEQHIKLSIDKVIYTFIFSSWDGYLELTFDNIPFVPRVGEDISMSFFYDTIGSRSFYVESIEHSIGENHQEIRIYCKDGKLNTYWQWRKDKAVIEREISSREYIFDPDYILQNKIIHNRH